MEFSRGRPTAEELTAMTQRIAEDGYCVVEGALSAEETDAYREALVDLARQEIAEDVDYVYENGSNQRVWALLNKGERYIELAQHPLALGIMEEVLGSGFLLSNINANIAGPGGTPMFLHSDQDYVPPPFPEYSLVSNVIWMLDDFTDANGATRVVVGSHKLRRRADFSRQGETVAITGPRGSALVLHGAVWHQTGANTTEDQRRHAILAYYCRPFMRQQENWSRSLDPDVAERATPALRQLLGFNIYLGGLGMVRGLPRNAMRF
jgi:ectoine hydroxylase-related dioxygenase (phytanoyl-CoA dioxygenase family)